MAFKTKHKLEYGDFQTPQQLADRATAVVRQLGINFHSVIEPTCGEGSFLLATINQLDANQYYGIDINQLYINKLQNILSKHPRQKSIKLKEGDFFSIDWKSIISSLADPILIIGNPPWVTSSELGSVNSVNLPTKTNFQARRGVDAITGKSNFDISEWMILQYILWLNNRQGIIAVLCKTAVARKILCYAWKQELNISAARIYKINAFKYFNAAVDACLLIIDMLNTDKQKHCVIYDNIDSELPDHSIGYHEGIVVADVAKYRKWKFLAGINLMHTWRSGIKHDCSKVMELEKLNSKYLNGYNQSFELEEQYIYPLIKSSDIGNNDIIFGRKYMLVTQQYIGEDTTRIKYEAPATWKYLNMYSAQLNNRASSIYRNKPAFAIFGVGDYSFYQWKVAISGLYKQLTFKPVGPFNNKPVVFDDTVNFIPCRTEAEAYFICSVLNSAPAQEFLQSMIFWTDKRPITIEILKRLSISKLCQYIGKSEEYNLFQTEWKYNDSIKNNGQLSFSIAERKHRYK